MPTINNNNNNGYRHPTLPSRLDPLFKLTCTRIFKPGNMLEDEDFKLCLDIDDYITKARKEKRKKKKQEQEQRRMEEELKEGTGVEKRKIDQVGFDGDDDESAESASKKAKVSSSSTSASVPSLPELPLRTPGSSSFDETGSGLDAMSSQPSSSTSTGDTNPNEETNHSQRFPYPPYAALLKKTTGSGINITTSIATTRLPRKSGTQFTIYEDPQERQELYKNVYNEYSPLEYSSPSEDKENSEESLSGERDSDVEMMSDVSRDVDVDVDVDGDEEMGDGDDAGDGDGEGEASSESVSILQGTTRHGTVDPESYGAGSNDPA